MSEDDFCDGCDESPCICEPDPDVLDERAARWTCIGGDCINPHPIHMRDECYTVEMAEELGKEVAQ